MPRPAIAVVISARNAEATLPGTLDALAAQVGAPPLEVIVIDNVSTDATGAIARAHPLQPTVIRRDEPGGPGVARNEGVAAATAPLIAFTDADCAPAPEWLACLHAAAERADIVQGRVTPPPGVPAGAFDHTLWIVGESGLYETANLLVRRAAFEAAGGFQDWMAIGDGRPFGEDTVLAWKLRRAGARTTFADDAIVHHQVLPGRIRGYLAERRRDGHFAGLVREVPELRRSFLQWGVFLDRRAAALDLGLLVLAVIRRPWALAAMLPWAGLVRAEAGRRGDPSPHIAAVVAAGDLAGLTSRLQGSLRFRTVVL